MQRLPPLQENGQANGLSQLADIEALVARVAQTTGLEWLADFAVVVNRPA